MLYISYLPGWWVWPGEEIREDRREILEVLHMHSELQRFLNVVEGGREREKRVRREGGREKRVRREGGREKRVRREGGREKRVRREGGREREEGKEGGLEKGLAAHEAYFHTPKSQRSSLYLMKSSLSSVAKRENVICSGI